MPNRLASSIQKVSLLPSALRVRALTTAVGTVVPFVGTAGVTVEELTESRAVVSTKNRRRVQNHIGGIHAAAMTLLAETASGFVVGMNVPDDKAPVVKSLSVAFKRRAKGGMRAVAELTDEQQRMLREDEKGELNVRVTVTDDSGAEPIEATMIWAFNPKRK